MLTLNVPILKKSNVVLIFLNLDLVVSEHIHIPVVQPSQPAFPPGSEVRRFCDPLFAYTCRMPRP